MTPDRKLANGQLVEDKEGERGPEMGGCLFTYHLSGHLARDYRLAFIWAQWADSEAWTVKVVNFDR